MTKTILGVGEFHATNKAGGVIKTLGLGSCVALICLDPETHAVGMDHIALPDSLCSPDRAVGLPGYFADTGIVVLLQTMRELGWNGNGKKLIVKLVGGANVADPNNTFNIGKRNILAIKKILWKHGMGARAEDVGGHRSRSVAVDVNTGTVMVASPGRRPRVV